MSGTERCLRRLVVVAATAATILAASAGTAPARAEEGEPGKLATVWVFWPEKGHEAEFEAGVEAHAAWRKEAGEGFVWNVYEPVVGADLGHYVIRSSGHHWADFDAQEAWERESGAQQKAGEQIGAHVARVEHYLSQLDLERSKWDESHDYRYFGVNSLRLRPGAYGEMLGALSKVHQAAVEKEWPKSFSVAWTIGGEGRLTVVTPATSWADMAEPETPFMKLLAESLGSEEEARETMGALQGAFEASSYTIYQHRPDLSTPN